MSDDTDDAVICHGTHLGNAQYSHDPTPMVEAALGGGEVSLRCPKCGTVVEGRFDD